MHALDLLTLIVGDVVGKFKQCRVIGGPRLFSQILDHVERALVVRDHQSQELAVKSRPRRVGQGTHLLGCCHAAHASMVMGVRGSCQRFTPLR